MEASELEELQFDCVDSDDMIRELFVSLLVHALIHEVGHALMHRHFFWIQIVGARCPSRAVPEPDLVPMEVRHRLEYEADDFATMHLLRLGCLDGSAVQR